MVGEHYTFDFCVDIVVGYICHFQNDSKYELCQILVLFSPFESIIPIEDRVIKEVTFVLREWNVAWKKLFVVSFSFVQSCLNHQWIEAQWHILYLYFWRRFKKHIDLSSTDEYQTFCKMFWSEM